MVGPTRIVCLSEGARGQPEDDTRRHARALGHALDVPVCAVGPLGEGPRRAVADVDALARALSGRPALLVKAARAGRRAVRPGSGPSDRDLLRSLPASMWLVARERAAADEPVVAAVALEADAVDPLDRGVLRLAGALACAEGRGLLLVHVWTFVGESIVSCPIRGLGGEAARRAAGALRRERARRLEELVADAGVGLLEPGILVKGDRARGLRHVLAGRRAAVLVIGYRGRSGVWGAIRGNLAEGFLGMPDLSIVAVRPDEACVLPERKPALERARGVRGPGPGRRARRVRGSRARVRASA